MLNSLIGVALKKIDWTSFLNCERGLLIAPAGHGKTTAIADCLLQKGMIIRNLASYGLNAIRITIGTEKQNTQFFTLFNTYLNKK